MARRRKKRTQVIASTTDAKQPKHITIAFVMSIIFTLVLGGIPFGLGKHIELNSPGPFDSGAYVYSAKHLLEGAQMGVEEYPSARPGTLIANIIGVKLFGFNDTGPKIMQMILQLAALIFMFITLYKCFGPVASVIGTTIAAVYLSAPLIAKFGNVKEQFMIAFMIYTACAFLWYEYTHKRLWLMVTGFFALQPYYFKPTGMSIVFAVVLYLLISRTLSRNWRTLWFELSIFLGGYAAGLILPGSLFIWQRDLPALLRTFPPVAVAAGAGVLILTGIVLAIVMLAEKKDITAIQKIPAWGWGIVIAAILLTTALTQQDRILAAAGLKSSGYLSGSLSAKGLSKVAPQIFRYYKALSVPILAALTSIITALVVWLHRRIKKSPVQDIQSKVVWMLAIWWILDIAFVWISPRSYEQYYLPLCASGAMLGGFVIREWQKRLLLSPNKMPWLAGGLAAVIALGCLSIPIFIGQRYSPDTGADYVKNYGGRRRGFSPALKELPGRQKGAWIAAGKYIRSNSTENDTLYVWGWMPGIYVQAQRLAPVPNAFESDMHVTPPETLQREIESMVNRMKQNPPKFIVDSRKRHFPNDRPPLELWPIVTDQSRKKRPLNNNEREIAAFELYYTNILEKKIDKDEAQRFQAMKLFRDFVMDDYRIAGQYGDHILFEHNKTPGQ